MFDSVKNKLQNALNSVKTLAAPAILAMGAVATSAHAAPGAIDASAVVDTIGTGLVAVAAIGAAWIGYRYLKKVWNSL